jgi:hypothetical protein
LPIIIALDFFNRLGRGELRVLGQKIGRDGVAVCRDDAGYDKKQRPQEDLDKHEQPQRERLPKIEKRENKRSNFGWPARYTERH